MNACSYRSSRCWDNSSTISTSRGPDNFSPANCFRIAGLKSGMRDSGNAIDSADNFLPAVALRGQDLSASRREAIITAPALSAFLNPTTPNPTAFFEAIEQGIKGGDIKAKHAARAQVD